MKKKSIYLLALMVILLAAVPGRMKFGAGVNEKKVPSQDGLTGYWELDREGAEEDNVLDFVTGLKIILPEEWQDEVVISASPDTLLVSDKKNVEAGAGGVLFYLTYYGHSGASAEYPYMLNRFIDTFLGVYQTAGSEYALVRELPVEMNYPEGNEELKKHYENLYASADKVQIITDQMPGFTGGGIDHLDWIEYDPYYDTDRENGDSFYLRYLSPEDMAVCDYLAKQKGPEFYLDGLRSDDIYWKYISINRLVEYFNDEEVRQKAVAAITPFLGSREEKLSSAASFALSILKKDYNDPHIFHLSDGSVIFTLFHDYSDYGSYNQVWMIQDDQLTSILKLSPPMMYITRILLSPDRTRFAVLSCSNKSGYLTVYDRADNRISPELVDSSRFLAAKDKGYPMWQRSDFENYSSIESCYWDDDDNITFQASLAFDGTEIVQQAVITYHVKDKTMSYQLIH